MRRFGLLILTNILIMFSVTAILNFIGAGPYLNKMGIDYISLAVFSLVWGFTGSFISLLLSKSIAKRAYGVRVLRENSALPLEANLVALVYRVARRAGLSSMPEVGIYESAEVNAFATGYSKRSSLVAVSTGLLDNMDLDQLEGVLAHEVAHIQNGDMVTMTLLQGLVNSFTIFISRVLASVVAGFISRDRETSPFLRFMLVQAFDVILTLFGAMVVAWFSRYREFRADEGGAEYSSKYKMVAALEFLRQNYEVNQNLNAQGPQKLMAMKISGARLKGLTYLFSSHPSLGSRIERLQRR